MALFSLRSCVALLARSAAYRKNQGFEKRKWIPFCDQEPILDPSRVFHSLAYGAKERLIAGPSFFKPISNTMRYGTRDPASGCHCLTLKCGLSSYLSLRHLRPGWLVRQRKRQTDAPYQLNLASLSCLPSSPFWREFLLGQEVTPRPIIRLDQSDPPPRSLLVHYCCHLLLLDHAFRSH